MPSNTDVINGIRINVGVSDCGQLMGKTTENALLSHEPEGTYEHLAVGTLEEGYTLAYKINGNENIKYDVYQSTNGINCKSSHICKNDNDEFVKMTESQTDDGLITIKQSFIFSKNANRVIIQMKLINCGEKALDLDDLLIKRYADLDVDTGGTAGWAGFKARWDVTRYSVFTYNLDSDAPDKKRGHVVNMVAMPSDLPLDGAFVGQLGSQQFASRGNPNLLGPLPTNRVDGDGILQWKASKFRSGECIRINMYYDCYRSFANNVVIL